MRRVIDKIRDISDLVGGCTDCDARLTIHNSASAANPALTIQAVTVTHRATCPWAKRFVSARGKLIAKGRQTLWHTFEDSDLTPADADMQVFED
jgi:hypothetical protein